MKIKVLLFSHEDDVITYSQLIQENEFQLIVIRSQSELLNLLESYCSFVLITNEEQFEAIEDDIKEFIKNEIPIIFLSTSFQSKTHELYKYLDYIYSGDNFECVKRKIKNAVVYSELKMRNAFLQDDINELQNKEFGLLKRNILSNLSHELRTPLNGILGFTHLLVSDEVPYIRKKEYYEFIEQSSERLINYVDNISELVNLERPNNKLRIGVYSTNNLLKSLLDKYSAIAKTKKIKLSMLNNYPLNEQSILIDGVKIHLIFSKLISCAVYHSENCSIQFGIQSSKRNHIEFFYKEDFCWNSESNILKSLMSDTQNEMYSLDNTSIESQIIRKYFHELKAKYTVEDRGYEGRSLFFKVPFSKIYSGLKKRKLLR